MLERARAQAAAEVERVEAELADTLGAWRDIPVIPTTADYERELLVAPFQHSEPPPNRPDPSSAERAHREEVRQAVVAVTPQSPLLRSLWLIVMAVCFACVAPFDVGLALQVAPFVGVLTMLAVSAWWRKHLRPISEARAAAEWPAQLQRIQAAHAQAVAEYERRAFKAKADWTAKEHKRVAVLRALMNGDLDRIGEAVTEAIEAIDFPFETQCIVVVDDEDDVLIDVDLPEIEDVVPEEELRVLKDGSLSEKKRKVAERNYLYAELVCGIALAVAANAVSAAPTLRAATIAGRTQRAKRGSGVVEDNYVYEVKLPRGLLASFNAATDDPLEAFRRAGARMQVSANGSLRTIAPPSWAGGR